MAPKKGGETKAKAVGKQLKKGLSTRKTRVHTKVHFYRPKTLQLDRKPKVSLPPTHPPTYVMQLFPRTHPPFLPPVLARRRRRRRRKGGGEREVGVGGVLVGEWVDA